MYAVIVTVDGHLYGLLVDQVEDVIAVPGEPMPSRALLSHGWTRMIDGVLDHEGEPLLLINVPLLIGGPMPMAA